MPACSALPNTRILRLGSDCALDAIYPQMNESSADKQTHYLEMGLTFSLSTFLSLVMPNEHSLMFPLRRCEQMWYSARK
jgi:hypothetical protein